MKKIIVFMLALCLLLTGCASSQDVHQAEPAAPQTEAPALQTEAAAPVTVLPLADTTLDNLDNCTVAVALEKGDAYLDDTGIMRMTLQIYSYDLFDMVDIAQLKAGDTIVLCGEEVAVASVTKNEHGTVLINGGLEEDGYDLVTDDSGVYFARSYNDLKLWNFLGEATVRVSTEFEYTDSSNLDADPVTFFPGDFLIENPDIDYFFHPQNTTVRIENGQIVAMERVYTP